MYKFTSSFFSFKFVENFSTALYSLNDVKFNTASFKIPLYSLLYSSALLTDGKYLFEKYTNLDIIIPEKSIVATIKIFTFIVYKTTKLLAIEVNSEINLVVIWVFKLVTSLFISLIAVDIFPV